MTSLATIIIPDAAPSLPELEATPATVDSFVDSILAAAVGADDYSVFVGSKSVLDGWYGDAADAYGSFVKQAGTHSEPVAIALRGGAGAASTYSDSLTTLETDLATLASLASTYGSDRQSLIDAKGAVEITDEAAIAELVGRADALSGDLTTLTTEISTWKSSAKAADTTLATTLRVYGTVASTLQAGQGVDPLASATGKGNYPGPNSTPESNAAWWDSLTPAERMAMLAAHPEVVGASDGLPADIRDTANRAVLANDLSALESQAPEERTAEEQQRLDNAIETRKALDDASHVDPITGEPVPKYLYVYKPDAHGGDGGVAISLGNPDEVDNLAVSVPGVNNNMQGVTDGVNNAYNLLHASRTSDPDARTGVMFWLDYNSPSDDDLVGTPFPDAARDGAANLIELVDGIRTNSGTDTKITAVGHSYGSVVTSQAGAMGLDVDRHILIGSPGPGTENGIHTASDLGVSKENVFVGTASHDEVADISDGPIFHGPDVTGDRFDAVRFTAESEDRGSRDDTMAFGAVATDDHNRYFDATYHDPYDTVPDSRDEPNNYSTAEGAASVTYSESLQNMGNIVVGATGEVVEAKDEYIDQTPQGPNRVDPEEDHTPAPVKVDLTKLRD